LNPTFTIWMLRLLLVKISPARKEEVAGIENVQLLNAR